MVRSVILVAAKCCISHRDADPALDSAHDCDGSNGLDFEIPVDDAIDQT